MLLKTCAMARIVEPESLETLCLENEIAVRRVRRMVEFLGVVCTYEALVGERVRGAGHFDRARELTVAPRSGRFRRSQHDRVDAAKIAASE